MDDVWTPVATSASVWSDQQNALGSWYAIRLTGPVNIFWGGRSSALLWGSDNLLAWGSISAASWNETGF
jgi:hypothetical protein